MPREGGVVVLAALEVVKQAHVHVHLADVLMRQLAGLEIDQDEALEQIVVEDQIDIEMRGLGADAELAGDEGEAFAEFKQELLKPADERGLEFFLMQPLVFGQIEKFEDVRVFHDAVGFGRLLALRRRGW